MLLKDINKRITLDQAVNYPFFDSVRSTYVSNWVILIFENL